MTDEGDREGKAGYRKPPAATRFREGQSGNPRGRPKGRRNQAPYEAVLGQKVTIREDGVERCVTAAEAILLLMAKRGLEGDGASGRATMAAIEQAKACGWVGNGVETINLTIRGVAPGSVSGTLELLRMAKKLHRYSESAKMMLEPWLVEMALARLGDRRLTIEEQTEVVHVTRTPSKVRWPEWWQIGSQ